MYEETFPASNENAQYYIRIESETGAVYDGFIWDETVQKIIKVIEES